MAIKKIGPFSLDTTGAKKIGKSFLLTVASAGIIALGDFLNLIDFGTYSYVAVAIPFVLNFLKKWVGTYEAEE